MAVRWRADPIVRNKGSFSHELPLGGAMSVVVDVEAVVVSVPAEGNAFTETDTEDMLIVLVTDENGLVGFGECGATPHVLKKMIEHPSEHFWSTGIKEHVIGRDPIEALAIYDSIYHASSYHGRRGSWINALSAVDIALYDLAGKQLDKPVWKLLGGARQPGARPYVTLYPGDTRGEPTHQILKKMEEIIELAHGMGFTAMKVPFIGFTELADHDIVEFMTECRRLVGDDITLGTDPGYRWSHWQEALWVLNRLDDLRVYFAEVPLRHDDIEGYRELAARSPVLVGAGEFSTGRWEAKEWLERANVPLLHCGISRAGGFTELSRISEMCELAGALLMPHSYATAISDFCNIHLQIASMQVPMVEFRTIEPVTSILRRDLIHPAMPEIKDGIVAPPEGPGLGIELNMDLVNQFRQ